MRVMTMRVKRGERVMYRTLLYLDVVTDRHSLFSGEFDVWCESRGRRRVHEGKKLCSIYSGRSRAGVEITTIAKAHVRAVQVTCVEKAHEGRQPPVINNVTDHHSMWRRIHRGAEKFTETQSKRQFRYCR